MTKEEEFLQHVKRITDGINRRLTADAHANFVQLYKHRTDLTSGDIMDLAHKQVNRQLSQELYLNLSK